ncbi:VanZ family protein [Thermocoleostomius sinensis]|uniref:VanZ family protein n=1 Tax=Thermocoleostomius sinensis A174 TaxID=2016057 RepID=A0A9E8ZPL1_9CYAN|nr:VanZ family protein [Thermocoleostomius sinensis]WAL62591.1 VanZ family protein [Thermocoleostomius sinensis A174]
MRKFSTADRSNSALPPQSGNFLKRSSVGLTIGGIGLILVATLFPFNFSPPQLAPIEAFAYFNRSGNLIDQIGNIGLFVPFGYGITGLIRQQGRSRWVAFIIAAILSTSLSMLVELLQFFLPKRTPTVTDLIANSLGGSTGATLWFTAEKAVDRVPNLLGCLRTKLALKILSVAFLGYVLLTAGLAMMLQSQTHLNNWDDSFPLVLGNETTGDRPWQGQLAAISLYDAALSETEVAALLSNHALFTSPLVSYQLKAPGIYTDQTGKFPDLFWSANAVSFPPPGAFATLIRSIQQSSQLTLLAIVATHHASQTGPARIISISNGTLLRNLTLGQQGHDLAIRLRTPITGENAKYPELLVPNFFLDQVPHRVVMTYRYSRLVCYIDRVQKAYSIDLSPEVIFFRYLLPFSEWSVRLSPAELWAYKISYYSLIFIPLGILLGLIAIVSARTFTIYSGLGLGGIALPTLLLEFVWSSSAHRSFSVVNLGLAIGLLAVTALITVRLLQRVILLSASQPTNRRNNA